jgi:hypothetical protein
MGQKTQTVKYGFYGLIVLAILIATGGGLELAGVHWYAYIAPKKEAARRKVFEETRSYNQGKVQQLAKYRSEYAQAEPEAKEVIQSTIKHQFADFPKDNLPPELRSFLTAMRGY